MSKLSELIRNPYAIFRFLNHRGMLKNMSDEQFVKVMYRAYIGKVLDLEHPKTYNEKIQWIKLYDRKPEYKRNADKYAVRAYIRDVLGEEYLVPIVGVYERAEDIPWDELPEKFVLKCTHSSHQNIICRDKSKLDKEEACKQMNGWLKTSGFTFGREWCYKDIPPMILCEHFIETADGRPPVDYKFMCFNGEPKLIQVHKNRDCEDYNLTYFTPEWKKLDIKRVDAATSDLSTPKPDKLPEMIEIARILSKGTYFSRIDLYFEGGKILFGEITYYPTSGFSTFADNTTDEYLGSLINLPTDK